MDDDEFDFEVQENPYDETGIPVTWADFPSAILGVLGLTLRGAADGILGFKRILDYHSLYRAQRHMARDSFQSEALRDIEAIVASPKES